MVEPVPAPAPVMPPVIVPRIQLNVDGVEAVKLIFVLLPLQIATEFAFVTSGLGFTVTVIEYALPGQEPVTDVGTTKYCTEPAELPGFVSV
jgi:hypothetical protein